MVALLPPGASEATMLAFGNRYCDGCGTEQLIFGFTPT
jgi:hypothetical protein